MTNKRQKSNILKDILYLSFVLNFVLYLFPVNALAYLDPGSGSYVVQILIASLAGIGFFVKTYWKQIKGIFSQRNKNSKEKSDEQD